MKRLAVTQKPHSQAAAINTVCNKPHTHTDGRRARRDGGRKRGLLIALRLAGSQADELENENEARRVGLET